MFVYTVTKTYPGYKHDGCTSNLCTSYRFLPCVLDVLCQVLFLLNFVTCHLSLFLTLWFSSPPFISVIFWVSLSVSFSPYSFPLSLLLSSLLLLSCLPLFIFSLQFLPYSFCSSSLFPSCHSPDFPCLLLSQTLSPYVHSLLCVRVCLSVYPVF